MEMNCRGAAEAVSGNILTEGPNEGPIRQLVIDSRQAGEGDFFIPLPGEHTDGHQFLEQVAHKGAAGCFIRKDQASRAVPGMFSIGVDDTLEALQKLAAVYRNKFHLPVIGVTGSVGKTTTKDLIAAVLSSRFQTLKTEGNLNNQIGLPLMLSRLNNQVQAAVLEMGMSGFGEISLLARIARPQIGVITNIGESHIEMLGSREGIAQAKSELLLHLPDDGAAIVNGDEPLLAPHLQNLRCQVITFGFTEESTLYCSNVAGNGEGKTVCIRQDGYPPLKIKPPLPGKHNISNLMAAVAAARWLKLSDQQIMAGLEQLQMSAMRLEMLTLPGGLFVINDAYNASPTSMRAALDVLLEKAGPAGKIAVLGDMLELGNFEEEGHKVVGKLAAACGLKALLTVGERAKWIAGGAAAAGMTLDRIRICATHDEAAAAIQAIAARGDYLLLKGSRGMRMEEVLHALRRED